MKTQIILLVILFSIFSILNSCKEDCPPAPDNFKTGGKIKGQVIDSYTYLPMEGVYISTMPPTSTMLTNINGEFIIEVSKNNEYKISANKKGYLSNMQTIYVGNGAIVNAVIPLHDSSYSNRLPDKPILLSPSNKSVCDYKVNLKWKCSDIDQNPLTYDVYLDDNSYPTAKIYTGINQSEISVNNLTVGKTYYWRVVARDNYSAEAESDIYSFTPQATNLRPENLVFLFRFDNECSLLSQYIFSKTDNIYTFITDKNNMPNQAAYFDGNKNITIKDADELDLTNEFTVALWLKPDEDFSLNKDWFVQLIGRWRNNGTGANKSSYAIHLDGSSKKIVSGTYNYAYKDSSFLCYSKSTIQDNQWMHVAFTYSAGIGRIYINGKLENVAVMPPAQKSDYNLVIGMQDDRTRSYKGVMDEILIYNIALTESEIIFLAK